MASTTDAVQKKTKKPAAPPAHPKYAEMIAEALKTLKERGGSSRQAVLKYIMGHFKVGDENQVNSHLKMALKAGVKNGSLKQAKGTGASGSFRLGEVKKAPKPKKVKTPPKKADTKPKKKSATKETDAKKPKASPKKKAATTKAKAAKSPAKAKKAAAKPKKATKSPAKPKKAPAKGKATTKVKKTAKKSS